MKTFISIIIVFVIMALVIINTSYNDRIRELRQTTKDMSRAFTLAATLDSLRLLWYESKVSIMESAIYKLSDTHPGALSLEVSAMKENDRIWQGILNQTFGVKYDKNNGH